jgi:hypothetical protein
MDGRDHLSWDSGFSTRFIFSEGAIETAKHERFTLARQRNESNLVLATMFWRLRLEPHPRAHYLIGPTKFCGAEEMLDLLFTPWTPQTPFPGQISPGTFPL